MLVSICTAIVVSTFLRYNNDTIYNSTWLPLPESILSFRLYRFIYFIPVELKHDYIFIIIQQHRDNQLTLHMTWLGWENANIQLFVSECQTI